MFVSTCPVCRNTVVYNDFEESLYIERCPHCERRREFETELAVDNFLEDEKTYMKIYSPLFIKKFLSAKKNRLTFFKTL